MIWRLALSIIAGADAHDASVVPMPIGDIDAVDVGALRVAHFEAFDGAACSSEVVGALSAAVDVLSKECASVRGAVPPRIEESMAITRAYWARPESVSTKAWRPWGKSTLSADDVERSLFEWDRLRRAFLGFMSEFDVIVCPVAATATPPTGAADKPEDYVYMLPFSLVGLSGCRGESRHVERWNADRRADRGETVVRTRRACGGAHH